MGVRAGVGQGEAKSVRGEGLTDAVEHRDVPGVPEVVDDDPDGAGPGAGEDGGGAVRAVAELRDGCEHRGAAAGETPGSSRSTIDTRDFETPARAATSMIVGGRGSR